MNEGDISGKVTFENNVHFLKVTEVNQAQIETFEEKSGELLDEIIDKKFWEDLILSTKFNFWFCYNSGAN
ncbi:MAG: hypothetical protein CM15mP12_7150 [Gammaproteobacteria bacterium]|nr:MAG: hypothetical protein CM15mP12_7150 [Gammaproteobacteria bacterium]